MKMYERVVSFVIALVILVGMIPMSAITANAVETANEYLTIQLEEEIIISTENNFGEAVFLFVPVETATYAFYSYNNDFDTYGLLYDSEMNEIANNVYGGGDANFRISYELTAGETYYFKSKPYYEGDFGTYTVKLSKLCPATSVNIIPDKDIEIYEGFDYRLAAEFKPENYIYESYTWSSDNTEVATIENDGNITALSAGTATITVTTENGLTDSVNVTVHAAAEIELNETKTATILSNVIGGVYVFTPDEDGKYIVYVESEYENNTSIKNSNGEWENSNIGYEMSVNADMTAGGKYFICTSFLNNNDNGYYTITVKKQVPATYVEISEDDINGYVGESYYLTALFGPDSAIYENVTWESDNESVVTINESGNMELVGVGTATVTVTSENGLTDSIIVTVSGRPVATSIIIGNGKDFDGFVGTIKYLWANFYPYDASTEPVTWTSDNETVATVSQDGRVTFLTTGTVNITVTSDSGLSDTCKITVKELAELTIGQPVQVSITNNNEQYVKFVPSESALFSLYVSELSNNNTTRIALYDSSMCWLADSYDNKPLQYEFEAGETYYITTNYWECYEEDNGTYYLNAVKPVPATSIAFDIGCEYTGYKETHRTINVIYSPDHAITESVAWSSSDINIVSVSRYGEINLKATGTATITATTENGLVASCVVTVKDYPTITENEETTVELDPNNPYAYFYFTPEKDGYYSFYSNSENDTYGCILDSNWNELNSDDDGGVDNNFKVGYKLKAGTTYILQANFLNSDNSGTFKVCVEQIKYVTKLEIVSMPEKTEYIKDFDYSPNYNGMKLKATWSDGSTTDWEYKGEMQIGGEPVYEDNSQFAETGEVVINCGDASVTLSFEVIENPVDHIELVSGTSYTYIENNGGYISNNSNGEFFYYYVQFPNDAVIKIVYKNGTSTTANIGSDVDGHSVYYGENQYSEPWTLGSNNYLTVYYLGHTVNMPITVKKNNVSSIEVVSGKITCLENAYGEETEDGYYYYYDIPSDVTIKINYVNGTSKTVGIYDNIDGYWINTEPTQDETPWVLGDNNYLTVSYLGSKAQIPVSVIANPVERIEINSAPTREYFYGDTEFGDLYWDGEEQCYDFYPSDMTGLSFTVYYNNGTHETFTGDDIDEYDKINGYRCELYYDGYNPELGDLPIEFMYMGKTDNYTVKLKESTVSSIAITKQPNKLVFDNNYQPDFIGAEFTITFKNSSTEVVTLTDENVKYTYIPWWGELCYYVELNGNNLIIEPGYDGEDSKYFVASYLGAQCEIKNITFNEGKEIDSVKLDNVSCNGDGMVVNVMYTDETSETFTVDIIDMFDWDDSTITAYTKTENGLLNYDICTYTDKNGNITKYNVSILGKEVVVFTGAALNGDVDGDGNVDVIDLALLKKVVAGIMDETGLQNLDIDQDQKIDVIDLAILKKMVAGII